MAPRWSSELRMAARHPMDLVTRGLISPEHAQKLTKVTERYEFLVSDYYLSLIDPSDPHCPIRKQAIPQIEELHISSQEQLDPIGDERFSPTPILVHRYPDRALLFPTFRCPMFCRYCFRKDSLNQRSIKLHKDLPPTLEYLHAHPEIEELILSGGDPLMLSNSKLEQLFQVLKETPIQRIRLHTRFPVTLPQRIDIALCKILHDSRPITVVTHFNHPKEVTAIAKEGLQRLKKAGVMVLNQSVLLKGINDHPDTLRTLCLRLVDQAVSPYYLHHPDLTQGTQHFRVSLNEGLSIMKKLKGSISGYALPRYVIDIPNGGGKIEINSDAAKETEITGVWKLRSPINGEWQNYIDPAEYKRV